jgi:mevalonate kinase
VRALTESANQRISESAKRQYAIRNTQYAIPPADISALVYEVERLHHGTPSGIDNTVVVYGQPVYFVRGQPPQTFAIGRPFTLAIADSGIASPTRIAVGDVRRSWEQEPARFEGLFDRVAAIVEDARTTIAGGQPERLGPLMDRNHALLQEIGVSCPELDTLVAAARGAGALGAKLSGAGRGGNMIALVTTETASRVAEALTVAGAVRVIVTEVGTKDEHLPLPAGAG